MAGIKFRLENGDKLGKKFETRIRRYNEKQIKAVQATARQIKDEVEYAGRADMRAGGDFGSSRWQEGLNVALSYESRSDIRLRLTHRVKYWKVFEYGATILGKPMLWIPLDFGNAFGVRARDYPLPLFKVEREGKAPLLVDPQNGPQYFGKESVTIPKKWHLRQIFKRISSNAAAYYRTHMRNS